jgi:hypothetical protein
MSLINKTKVRVQTGQTLMPQIPFEDGSLATVHARDYGAWWSLTKSYHLVTIL